MTVQRRIAFAAAVSLVALGACAQSQKQIAYSNRAHLQLSAEEVTAELKIEPSQGERLSELEREAVRVFAASYQSEGHGAVVISRPAGGQNEASAVRAAADARAVLLAEGVEPTHIAEGPYEARNGANGALVLSYRTWEAVVPNCPDVSRYNMAWTGTNSALPSLGCATAANLAAMVANPADLAGARPMDPADQTRRSIVMSKYKNGEATAAAKNSGASGTVSSVGN